MGCSMQKNLRELMSECYQQSTAVTSVMPKGSLGVTVVMMASGCQIIVDKKRQKRKKTGRRSSRRGSEDTGKHSDALFGSGSTYRSRLNGAGQSRNASSNGIATGKGVDTSNIITSEP